MQKIKMGLGVPLLVLTAVPCFAQTADVFVKGDPNQCWLDVKDIVHRRGSRVTENEERWTLEAGHFSTMRGDLVLQVHVSPDKDKNGEMGCRIYVSVSGGADLDIVGRRINSMNDNYRFAQLIAAEVKGMKEGRGNTTPMPGGIISVAEEAIPEEAKGEFRKGKELLEEKHDPVGSVDHFKKAIKLYNNFPQANTLLGLAYLQNQRLPEAKNALERAIELDQTSGMPYIALGGCLNQMKDFPDAEKVLTKGLKILPDSPEGNYELAKTYWALRRWQDAEPHAVKAEKLEPDVAGVHVLMGNIFLQRRDTDGALKEFNEYLKLDPHGPMSDSVRAMVAKLEKASGTNK